MDRTKITPNFERWEFTLSETAARHGISNEPDDAAWQRIELLCKRVLEPVREQFGPVRVTSGYRSPQVNRLIGGARNSQHMIGEAADVVPLRATLGDVYRWIYRNITYDQLIWEFGRWIHVSYTREGPEGNRVVPLRASKTANGSTVYTPVEYSEVLSLT